VSRATGCVNWPTHLHDSGEGGMVVLAVWRTLPRWSPRADQPGDPFAACFEATSLRFAIGECNDVTDHDGISEEPFFRPGADGSRRELSVNVLAVLQLGSTAASYVGPAHEFDYWNCTRADLTLEGATLLAGLDRLYGRAAQLLTILDT